MNWTQAEYDAHCQRQKATPAAQAAPGATPPATAKKRTKFHNEPVLVDLGPSGEIVNGHLRLVHLFQSKREADYYAELVLRRLAGDILNLRLQEPFALIARAEDGSPHIVGEWLADFTFDTLGRDALIDARHVVDAKGVKNALYLLKKKIVEACWNIVIEEV